MVNLPLTHQEGPSPDLNLINGLVSYFKSEQAKPEMGKDSLWFELRLLGGHRSLRKDIMENL